jgi:hypothetical protein
MAMATATATATATMAGKARKSHSGYSSTVDCR